MTTPSICAPFNADTPTAIWFELAFQTHGNTDRLRTVQRQVHNHMRSLRLVSMRAGPYYMVAGDDREIGSPEQAEIRTWLLAQREIEMLSISEPQLLAPNWPPFDPRDRSPDGVEAHQFVREVLAYMARQIPVLRREVAAHAVSARKSAG